MENRVLKLVTTNNVEIFRHLGSAAFKRTAIEHHVAKDAAEAESLIRSVQPDVAILDTDLAGGSGFELCKLIKSDPQLRRIHVVLAHRSVVSKEDLRRTADSGCDDMLALPIHPDDFYAHLAQLTGVAFRGPRRVAVALSVEVNTGKTVLRGSVFNLSPAGLGMRLPADLPQGRVTVNLIYQEERYPGIDSDIAWSRPDHDGFLAGLRFRDIPKKARSLLAQLSLFQLRPSDEGKGVTASLQGIFDEQTDFRPLLASLADEPHVDFMMQGVTYMSSSGVRAWCNFIGQLQGKSYSFRHCSLAFASQAAMVPMVTGEGEVISVEAPYFCETCDREETRLVESALVKQADGTVQAPPLHCHVCGSALEFDDIPGRYFAFLQEI
jgi:CheY-like chemotaxis protein